MKSIVRLTIAMEFTSLKYFTILIFLLVSVGCRAQGLKLKEVMHHSPDVASLGKFSEVPVGHYTGIPNISIPLYEVRNGALTMPVAISYHAGGVRVEEVASRVGLSWSLMAGGMITRSVRGLPDDFGSWQSQPIQDQIETIVNSNDPTRLNLLIRDIENRVVDGEADLYTFNFNGRIGKFVFDQSGTPQIITQQNLLISPFEAGWKIVDEAGTSYIFNKAEYVSSSGCMGDQIVYTAWFLTDVISSDGKRSITLTYDPVMFDFTVLLGETKYFLYFGIGSPCIKNDGGCLGNEAYFSHRLSKIDFESGYLKFSYNTSRCDVLGDRMLDEIEIFSSSDMPIKKFVLTHSYFGTHNGCDSYEATSKRLKLESIAEISQGLSIPPHVFTYDENGPFPDRLSKAQDHWGYFNGANNNSLISEFSMVHFNGEVAFYPGANRRTNPDKAQIGIIKKIKYPTGGETIFTFESNVVNDDRVEAGFDERYLSYTVNNYLVSELPDPLGATPLVIPEGGARVEFGNISGLDELWSGCDIVECWVTRNNQPFRRLANSLNQGFEFWDAGVYSLSLVVECGMHSIANFNVLVTARIPRAAPGDDRRVVGGLRVVQIEDVPDDRGPSIIREYHYVREEDAEKSSGELINFPQYGHDLFVEYYSRNEQGEPLGPLQKASYRVRSSQSSYPLATTHGGYVGYSRVVEAIKNGGENHFYFRTHRDPISEFPFAPPEAFNWRRGFLEKNKSFKKINGQLIIVKEVINSPFEMGEVRVYGIKTGVSQKTLINCGTSWFADLQELPNYSYYPTISSFFGVVRTVQKIYDGINVIETSEEHVFNPQHLQIVETKIIASSKDEETEEYTINRKYPFDYSLDGTPTDGAAAAIVKLQENHIVNAVIEEYILKRKKKVSTGQVLEEGIVSGMVTAYKDVEPYPDMLLQLQIDRPIGDANFIGTSIHENSLFVNSAYKPVLSFTSYDEKGNLTGQQRINDVSFRYLWGYHKSLPIAEATNAPSLDDIAFTSFEENGGGNWTFDLNDIQNSEAHTGRKAYRLTSSNSISKPHLDNQKTYVLSFWHKSDASISVHGGTQTEIISQPGETGWLLSTRNISGSSSLSLTGSGLIDDLRVHPIDSQMKTYTYDPLVGITSVTDANMVVTKFEYDTLGRLIVVRDQHGNILKGYNYTYKE
jgi:YD repeat-containing protein